MGVANFQTFDKDVNVGLIQVNYVKRKGPKLNGVLSFFFVSKVWILRYQTLKLKKKTVSKICWGFCFKSVKIKF